MRFIKPDEIYPHIPEEYKRHAGFTPYTRFRFFRKLYWGRIKSIIKLFLKFEKKFQKIIEVGGGYGIFSTNFKLNFPESEIFLLDLIPKKTMDVIERILVNKFNINLNFNPECDITEKIPYSDNYFDLIFALDVLEHVKNPEIALKEILRVLNINGLLFISVPTEGNLLKLIRMIYSKFTSVVKEHHWKGTIKSEVEFYNLLKQKNVKILYEKKYPFNNLPRAFSYDIFYLIKKK